jgi:hypothetical protein
VDTSVAGGVVRFKREAALDAVCARYLELLKLFMATPAARENPRVAHRLLALGAKYPDARQVAGHHYTRKTVYSILLICHHSYASMSATPNHPMLLPTTMQKVSRTSSLGIPHQLW